MDFFSNLLVKNQIPTYFPLALHVYVFCICRFVKVWLEKYLKRNLCIESVMNVSSCHLSLNIEYNNNLSSIHIVVNMISDCIKYTLYANTKLL